MGKGRKRTPTAVLKLRGSRMQDRDPSREIKPDPGLPDMPQDMPDRAVEEWNTIGPMIAEQGYLCKVEPRVFEEYCRTVALVSELRQEGAEDVDCCPKLNRRLTDAQAFLLKLMVQIGLTPAARSTVRVEKPKAADDWLDTFTKDTG